MLQGKATFHVDFEATSCTVYMDALCHRRSESGSGSDADRENRLLQIVKFHQYHVPCHKYCGYSASLLPTATTNAP